MKDAAIILHKNFEFPSCSNENVPDDASERGSKPIRVGHKLDVWTAARGSHCTTSLCRTQLSRTLVGSTLLIA